ncbi:MULTISPECIES: hypothetical protein [unclassified Bradyrhizobium]|uniref:Aspartate racemase n=3 Tax=Bradyrhizobium septentrionale TaxID=1404411 RepID=A0ABZ2NWT8_9BRAD
MRRIGAGSTMLFSMKFAAVVISDQQDFIEIIARGRARGADAVILGCTEIGLLIGPEHTQLSLFDSAKLHAKAAADFADGKPPAGAVFS